MSTDIRGHEALFDDDDDDDDDDDYHREAPTGQCWVPGPWRVSGTGRVRPNGHRHIHTQPSLSGYREPDAWTRLELVTHRRRVERYGPLPAL